MLSRPRQLSRQSRGFKLLLFPRTSFPSPLLLLLLEREAARLTETMETGHLRLKDQGRSLSLLQTMTEVTTAMTTLTTKEAAEVAAVIRTDRNHRVIRILTTSRKVISQKY